MSARWPDVRRTFRATVLGACLSGALGAPAVAQDALAVSPIQLDRPTLTSLGVKMPFSGDTNQNSSVAVQYRISASAVPNPNAWKPALALWRVHPEVVTQEAL